jgi:hypothetical protein
MTAVNSPDPLAPIDELAESSPDMDFQAHVRTFNAVLSAAKWFIIHIFILLVALYFFAIGNQPVIGIFLILCSIGLLIFGLLRRPSVRADVMKAMDAAPGTARGAHVDYSPGAGDRTA